jgi:hypothetical protein
VTPLPNMFSWRNLYRLLMFSWYKLKKFLISKLPLGRWLICSHGLQIMWGNCPYRLSYGIIETLYLWKESKSHLIQYLLSHGVSYFPMIAPSNGYSVSPWSSSSSKVPSGTGLVFIQTGLSICKFLPEESSLPFHCLYLLPFLLPFWCVLGLKSLS